MLHRDVKWNNIKLKLGHQKEETLTACLLFLVCLFHRFQSQGCVLAKEVENLESREWMRCVSRVLRTLRERSSNV